MRSGPSLPTRNCLTGDRWFSPLKEREPCLLLLAGGRRPVGRGRGEGAREPPVASSCDACCGCLQGLLDRGEGGLVMGGLVY